MTATPEYHVQIKRKALSGTTWRLVGQVHDGPHETAKWLADMAKQVKREASLMDQAEMDSKQPSLWQDLPTGPLFPEEGD